VFGWPRPQRGRAPPKNYFSRGYRTTQGLWGGASGPASRLKRAGPAPCIPASSYVEGPPRARPAGPTRLSPRRVREGPRRVLCYPRHRTGGTRVNSRAREARSRGGPARIYPAGPPSDDANRDSRPGGAPACFGAEGSQPRSPIRTRSGARARTRFRVFPRRCGLLARGEPAEGGLKRRLILRVSLTLARAMARAGGRGAAAQRDPGRPSGDGMRRPGAQTPAGTLAQCRARGLSMGGRQPLPPWGGARSV